MGWIADLLKEIPSAARYKAELEEMEKENASLKAENATLKSQVETLRNELATLKTPSGGLPLDAEKILGFIAKNENTTAPHVARALGLNKGVVDMHLEDLMNSNHIDASFVMGEEPEYYLAQSGRRYLHGKGQL
jgi:predicted HTH transcriptional regulator